MSETANPQTKIHMVSGMERTVYNGLGTLLQQWQASLNYDSLEGLREIIRAKDGGMLILLWHNRLFPAIGAFKQARVPGRRVYALVSASRDGARISHFLETQGIRTVRGSSSRRGAVAARELLRILARGDHVAITVDGPRGPCYQAQPGASLLCQLTGAPVAYLGLECEAARELKSWDRFLIPEPFSRVKIKLDRSAAFPPERGKEQRKAIQEVIQFKLSNLTGDRHREG